ncbi:MAG TPA: hypothetical protein VIF34_13225 [Methylocystis sp.]
MLDLKFTALLDFLTWLRGQQPEEIKSLTEEELFVPYEKVDANKADATATLPVEGARPHENGGPAE